MSDIGRQNPSPGVLIADDQPTVVFLTVNTAHHGKWLAQECCHTALRAAWAEADAWRVGHYLLMPDHVHLFCAPVRREFSMEQWITYWKRRFWMQHRRSDWDWQSAGWHHRLRGTESYEEKWHYVQQNPVRAGLVTDAALWPHKGKLHDLIWRE